MYVSPYGDKESRDKYQTLFCENCIHAGIYLNEFSEEICPIRLLIIQNEYKKITKQLDFPKGLDDQFQEILDSLFFDENEKCRFYKEKSKKQLEPKPEKSLTSEDLEKMDTSKMSLDQKIQHERYTMHMQTKRMMKRKNAI